MTAPNRPRNKMSCTAPLLLNSPPPELLKRKRNPIAGVVNSTSVLVTFTHYEGAHLSIFQGFIVGSLSWVGSVHAFCFALIFTHHCMFEKLRGTLAPFEYDAVLACGFADDLEACHALVGISTNGQIANLAICQQLRPETPRQAPLTQSGAL